jgi:hypothetical protein
MDTVVKTLFSVKGNKLGEVFETATGYGFHHVDTNTTQTGFNDVESALNELCGVNDEHLESM